LTGSRSTETATSTSVARAASGFSRPGASTSAPCAFPRRRTTWPSATTTVKPSTSRRSRASTASDSRSRASARSERSREMSKIKVGTILPDFELPDEDGELHRLSELQGDDLMVLMLGRGEHCPRERQQQRERLKFCEGCSVAFTQLVTVLRNDLHDVFKLKISTGAHWTYLADTDLEVQQSLDIREYTDPIHAAHVPHTLS